MKEKWIWGCRMGLSHNIEVVGPFLPEGRTNWFMNHNSKLAFLLLLLLLPSLSPREGHVGTPVACLFWFATLCLNYQCWKMRHWYFLTSKASTAHAAWGGWDEPGCRVTTIWCLHIFGVSAHFLFVAYQSENEDTRRVLFFVILFLSDSNVFFWFNG